MRVIHENAKIRIVFLVIDMSMIRGILGKEDAQYVQLFSRIGKREYIPAIVPIEDVIDILKEYEIS